MLGKVRTELKALKAYVFNLEETIKTLRREAAVLCRKNNRLEKVIKENAPEEHGCLEEKYGF